jgi:hypothetical protein
VLASVHVLLRGRATRLLVERRLLQQRVQAGQQHAVQAVLAIASAAAVQLPQVWQQ